MYLLGLLTSFYNDSLLSRFLLVLVFWLVWPGLMFVVGLVGESREVPLWHRQSKAFFPGDLAFGIMLVAIISMYAKTGTDVPGLKSPAWWLIAVVLLGIISLSAHLNDISHYPPRAAISPTKITHNLMGFFIIPVVLVGLGVPQLNMLRVDGVFEATRMGWFAVAMAVVLYLFCTALDIMSPADTNDIYARHPDDWRPIWKTWNNRRW